MEDINRNWGKICASSACLSNMIPPPIVPKIFLSLWLGWRLRDPVALLGFSYPFPMTYTSAWCAIVPDHWNLTSLLIYPWLKEINDHWRSLQFGHNVQLLEIYDQRRRTELCSPIKIHPPVCYGILMWQRMVPNAENRTRFFCPFTLDQYGGRRHLQNPRPT